MAVDFRHGGHHLRVIKKGGFAENGFELMHEIDQAARAAYQGHPDLGADLLRGGFDVRVVNVGAFDGAPEGLLAAGPAGEALRSARDKFQLAGHLGRIMHGGINIEGSDVAALDVFGIVLGMVAANAAANPVVPGNPLAEVDHDRTGGIHGAHALVILDNGGGENWRAVALAAAEGLGVVRFILVHPAGDDGVVFEAERQLIQTTDHRHVGALQFLKLRGGWPLPKGDVEIYPRRLKSSGIGRALTPDGHGEEVGVHRQTVLGEDAVGGIG